MGDDRLGRLVDLYTSRGRAEKVEGDFSDTARQWLAKTADELSGVQALLAASQWRLAANAAYDVCRHAAEAVVTKIGLRITNAQGAHEATLELANAILGEASDAFSYDSAQRLRQKRNSLEYIDLDRSADVSEAEARWAYEVAEKAVRAAEAFLS